MIKGRRDKIILLKYTFTTCKVVFDSEIRLVEIFITRPRQPLNNVKIQGQLIF